MQVVYEKNGIANAAGSNGIAWVPTSGHVGAVSAGGWVEFTTGGVCEGCFSATDPGHTQFATASFPAAIVGTHAEYNANDGKTYFQVGFAVPPGAKVCAHLWVLVP